MSERGQIAVDVPISRYPTEAEQSQLLLSAAQEARKLLAPYKGKLLGLADVKSVNHAETNGIALQFLFAVEAPEQVWASRKSFAVNRG